MSGIDLRLLGGELAVARLGAGGEVLAGTSPGESGILSVTTTASETSIVCDPSAVPAGAQVSPGWRAIVVAGVLDHSLTGILASLAVPLAEAGIPIFAVSTFDTDYLLVPSGRVEVAGAALRRAGHRLDADA